MSALLTSQPRPKREGPRLHSAPGRIVLMFDSFGPYHLARWAAARESMDVMALEICGRSDDYDWYRHSEHGAKITLFPEATRSAVSRSRLRRSLHSCLDQLDPTAVAVPGWSLPASL